MRHEKNNGDDSGHASHHARAGLVVRTFTVEEAHSLLSDLRKRLRRLQEAAQALWERKREMQLVLCNGSCSECDCGLKAYKEELVASMKHMEYQSQALLREIRCLRESGILVRSIMDGIVDFPAYLDGQLIFLCWQIDEPTILYWHHISGGFGSRRLLSDLVPPLWSAAQVASAGAPI
ncbi:MAG: DUF2203 domain-containing protein [Thermoguttaceae bacterium]|nr:DUF2203 domain-containing protein [Thermoguttaceae bacterium]MDW8079074.1 DUF2203 domain-containing protein [Thermoguttaceae bacterium]